MTNKMRRRAWNWLRPRGKKREPESTVAMCSMNGCSPSRPVLILGAAPRISLPIARSLHRRGIPVEVASFQPEEPDLGSRALREHHRLPLRSQRSTEFSAALLALVTKKQFDVIIPASDPALAALAEAYDGLTPLLHVACPPPRTVERVLNKSLTLEIAQRIGIQVPFTETIATAAELEQIAPRLRFPLVVKPVQKGAAAFRALYFNHFEELDAAFENNPWGSVQVQEFCRGEGVGVEVLIHQGECVAKFQHRRLKEAPVTGGVSILAVAEEPDPELFRSAIELLRNLAWEGVAMVEFRVDRETGRSVLLEVNGRFWGSVSFPIAAGVDFPFYYWQLLHGERPNVPDRYAVGMRWRWSPGYLDRMQSVVFANPTPVGAKPSLARELLLAPADFSPFVKEALWSWPDPWPFFAEMGRMLWSFLAVLAKSAFWRVAPRRLKGYWRTYSRLEPMARASYTELRIRDAMGMSAGNGRPGSPRIAPARRNSYLFVCYGNLMRSPMAETMLKRLLSERGIDGVVVKSAGLHAVPGRPAHPWALAVSRELGMPLDDHRAQLLTPELMFGADAILAMDFENLAELRTLYPEAKQRISLVSQYAEGRQQNREIADPYFGDIEGTRQTYAVLRVCLENLVGEISSQLAESMPTSRT